MSHFKILNDLDFDLLPRRQRVHLVNALSGFKSINLIGTTNDAGVNNLSIISSVVHLGSDPALLGMVMRTPVDRERGSHTYWNIRETGCYTINHVPVSHSLQAHQVSARYSGETSEFEAVGFTPVYRCGFQAPAVEESPVRIGMERLDEWEIPQNRCRFVVGQIRWVEFPEEAWAEDGYLDIESLGVAVLSSLDGYHRTEKLHRLAYAKPDAYPPEAMKNFKAGWKDD
mgnify:FL=1|tara:strand:+ start:1141 stop:1824 length:684 start_codon:yes stop_codon:yes gene_type:complete